METFLNMKPLSPNFNSQSDLKTINQLLSVSGLLHLINGHQEASNPIINGELSEINVLDKKFNKIIREPIQK